MYYNWSLDELMLAAKLGFDGIGTNEHHQNPYGFMCNPNLFGAILGQDDPRSGIGSRRTLAARRHHFIVRRPFASPRNTPCSTV